MTASRYPFAVRVLAALCAAVLSFGLVAGLSGCSDNDEQAREALVQGITGELEELSALTSESVATLFPTQYAAELQAAGVDPVSVYGPLYVDLLYSIDAAQVEGDTATISLTITNKDLTQALQLYTATITNELGTQAGRDALAALDDAALTRHFAEVLVECLNATTDRVTTTVELVYVKDGDTWVLQNGDDLTVALLGGLDVTAVASPTEGQLLGSEGVAAANVAEIVSDQVL